MLKDIKVTMAGAWEVKRRVVGDEVRGGARSPGRWGLVDDGKEFGFPKKVE